ncbi:MAG: diguanylate cyclase [Deltaproteobacteria bacterium]|nr:diguanylate cyclase [Deltaproteobacteria bacterium]
MDSKDRTEIEGLLHVTGAAEGPRALMTVATQALVARLGDRGACVLVGPNKATSDDGGVHNDSALDAPSNDARVVVSTAFPLSQPFSLDLRRYPEISAALNNKDVVAIENVRGAPLLQEVAERLPGHLGAVAVVPLIAPQDRCVGAILIQSTLPRVMSADDIATARLEGRLVGTLLDLQFGALLDQLGSSAVPQPTLQAAAGAPETTRRRLLIADDVSEDAKWLAEELLGEGFDVTCAADGAEALLEAQREPPDLILLDVNMPIMDGFAAAAELAKDSRTAAVPILFLSGSDDLLPRVRNFNRDGVDFLSKPCSFLELLARIEKSLKQAESKRNLQLDAHVDELTGLGNLRSLREHFEREESRSGRTGSPLAIVMIDVDKLKQINDRHGHLVGSRVLKAIGETVQSEIRATDLAVRYGGDEFVVLLPHTTADEAMVFATRLLSRVNQLRPEGIVVSLSMGVAALDSVEPASDQPSETRAEQSLGRLSANAILVRADAAAYRAKNLGGNRVFRYDAGANVS